MEWVHLWLTTADVLGRVLSARWAHGDKASTRRSLLLTTGSPAYKVKFALLFLMTTVLFANLLGYLL